MSLDESLKNSNEDRRWNQFNPLDENGNVSKIEPLPITEEQYRACAMMTTKKAIYNNNPKACQEYFKLKRRAIYGNHYSEIVGMKDIEMQMWEIVSDEKTANNGRKR